MLLLETKVTKISETSEIPPSTTIKQLATGITRFRLQRVTDPLQITKEPLVSLNIVFCYEILYNPTVLNGETDLFN